LEVYLNCRKYYSNDKKAGITMKDADIGVGKKTIGSRNDVFVIAEIGINHNGSVLQAEKMIDVAAECGADAVKFQSYRADKLIIPSLDRYAQQNDAESAYQMLRRFELSFPEQEKLKKHADQRGVIFFSTPFDEESVDFLASLEVPLFKIASGDMTHMPLLQHVASKKKPILLSTGMSYLSEVAEALGYLRSAGAQEIILMHCVSAYPAAPREMNLRTLQTMHSHFELPVGLSDHSPGIMAPLIAAALGAVVIEKHFTLDKNAGGPDHKASMDPVDLRLLVKNLRDVEVYLGDARKRAVGSEVDSRLLGRRSIVAVTDIHVDDTIAPSMLACKRPGTGLEPKYWDKIIGKTARRNIEKDTILQWEDLAPSMFSQESVKETNKEQEAGELPLRPK
jgi:N,N'-diacetyllegionaminate synthase